MPVTLIITLFKYLTTTILLHKFRYNYNIIQHEVKYVPRIFRAISKA